MFCLIPLPKYRLRLKRAMVKVPSVPLLTVLLGPLKLSHTGLLIVFCQVEFPFRLLMLAGCRRKCRLHSVSTGTVQHRPNSHFVPSHRCHMIDQTASPTHQGPSISPATLKVWLLSLKISRLSWKSSEPLPNLVSRLHDSELYPPAVFFSV